MQNMFNQGGKFSPIKLQYKKTCNQSEALCVQLVKIIEVRNLIQQCPFKGTVGQSLLASVFLRSESDRFGIRYVGIR
jgi:hypothetical protein